MGGKEVCADGNATDNWDTPPAGGWGYHDNGAALALEARARRGCVRARSARSPRRARRPARGPAVLTPPLPAPICARRRLRQGAVHAEGGWHH